MKKTIKFKITSEDNKNIAVASNLISSVVMGTAVITDSHIVYNNKMDSNGKPIDADVTLKIDDFRPHTTTEIPASYTGQEHGVTISNDPKVLNKKYKIKNKKSQKELISILDKQIEKRIK